MNSDDTKLEQGGIPGSPAEAAVERRPYQKPSLRRLGSVRALTLGSTGGDFLDDGGFTRTPPAKM